ncbi:hypothetical protein [Natrononativus amylolyticus]|uniref:hypothetical protein n=1 Tax=Natrononativus amylolyticus TaxID=2963434 RepID=UPI0020CDDD8E|nr:hypothetical protein [Natrononativus amylolyticus]
MSRSRTIAFIAAVRHRVELRRRRKHPQLGLAVLLGATVGVLVIVGSLPLPLYAAFWPEPGAYHYGTVAGENAAAVAALTREIGAIGVVVVTVLAALGATTSDDWEEPPVELVTALSLPTAIAGVLVDELLENAWFVGPVAVAGAVAFAAGTGAPVTAVGALVGGLAVVLTGLLAGTAAGLGVRALIRRSPRLYAARYGVGIVVVFATFMGLALSRTAGGALAATPLGWYGDLILVTTPDGGADPVRALAALVGSAGIAALATATVLVAARSLWFAEAVLDDGTVDADAGGLAGSLTVGLEAVSGRQTAAVVRAVWRRIGRSPRAMIYVVLPFALVGPVTAEISSAQPAFVPPLVTLYVAAAVGMGTTLNPIGNERIALPVLLTTPGGRRAVLRGHALAALVPGVPLAVAVAVVTGVVGGYDGVSLVALVAVGAALTLASVGISLGVGAFLPTLEGPMAASLTPPELSAMVAHLLAMVLLALPAFAGFWLVGSGSSLAPAGVAATSIGAVAAGLVGYRYASAALERYEAGGEAPAADSPQ